MNKVHGANKVRSLVQPLYELVGESMINTTQTIKNSELFLEYNKKRDIDVRNLIFSKYQYLAEIISKKYMNKGIEYDDIYQIASIGLIYAIERFDINKGFEFTSFATPTILGEVKKYFRDKGWAIKIPRRIQEVSKRINDASNELQYKLGRAPNVRELSESLGYTEEEILEAMEASKLFVSQSINVSIESNNDSKEVEFSEIIRDEVNSYEIFENLDFLKRSFEFLNKMEKQIIIERFYNNKTQLEIAKQMNISQMTVSRIEKKVLEKIRAFVDK